MQLSKTGAARRNVLVRRAALVHRRMGRLDPTLRGLLWSTAAGILFAILNTELRRLAQQLHPFQVQCLRYVAGAAVMFPLIVRSGVLRFRPVSIASQFVRGGVHTVGLVLWFLSVTHIPLADTTAIGFTTPIFIMIGAVFVFREPMRADRWVAALLGLAGVLVVVGPGIAGSGGLYTLAMLASAPVFAASFLLTKALTRTERTEVIVLWQAISVALFSLPLAMWNWQWPTALQWLAFLFCGLIGSAGHFCLTRSYAVADISATQSVKFLDLVWAALLGWLVFGDIPTHSTIVGGLVICGSTVWIAHRAARSQNRG